MHHLYSHIDKNLLIIILRRMKSSPIKIIFTLLLALTLLMQGCGDSGSTKTKNSEHNDPRLMGAWQQTAIGKEQVSGVIVKVIFAEQTLTMDAPGCLIIGDYTSADDNVLSYTITAVQGERCSKTQLIGNSDTIQYRISDSQLFMRPLSGGEESQTEYKRIGS